MNKKIYIKTAILLVFGLCILAGCSTRQGAKEQHYLISYKHPVARFGTKELEENTTITFFLL